MKTFSQLFLQHMQNEHVALARVYLNGSWHQFSGRDVCAHISVATDYWRDIFPSQSKNTKLIFITSNSYHTFVASMAAILCGFHIMWLPSQISTEDIKTVLSDFPCAAIVTDIDDYSLCWQKLDTPVLGIQQITWMEYEKCSKRTIQKFEKLVQGTLGRFYFRSSGQRGVEKYESVQMDAFILVAQNFIDICDVAETIPWNSFEIMSPCHPFAHLSQFCTLLKNGILGFPNYGSDLETSLCILQPTYFFSGPMELEQISVLIRTYALKPAGFAQGNIKKTIKFVQHYLGTSKAMKIPEGIFSVLKGALRASSKLIAHQTLIPKGFENLQFIVHGFERASKNTVQLLERLGIPVIETYGTTHASGMLSSNSFRRPHLNTIGTPLSHVRFRLCAQSALEYKLDSSVFKKENVWKKTGDVAQITPFGFVIPH